MLVLFFLIYVQTQLYCTQVRSSELSQSALVFYKLIYAYLGELLQLYRFGINKITYISGLNANACKQKSGFSQVEFFCIT